MKLKIKEDVFAFCQNIKQLRKMHCLSQKEMADKLKISKGELERIENGFLPESVTVELLFQVQKNFAVRPQELFEDLKSKAPIK